jgi:hypothetical protein
MSPWLHEGRLLLRDAGARLILVGWILLLAYAGFLGVGTVEALRADQARFVEAATQERTAERERMLAVESGAAPADPYVGFPSILRSPVVMPVSPLAALDVGVLDRSNLSLRVSLFSGPQQAAKGRELQSPLLLAAGRFDLGFVAVVLLPLALIALLFAQPGDDRGESRLPLLAAQGALSALYLRRYLVRALALLLPLALVSALTILAAGATLELLSGWLIWLLPVLGWALFWGGACAFVGARAGCGTGAGVAGRALGQPALAAARRPRQPGRAGGPDTLGAGDAGSRTQRSAGGSAPPRGAVRKLRQRSSRTQCSDRTRRPCVDAKLLRPAAVRRRRHGGAAHPGAGPARCASRVARAAALVFPGTGARRGFGAQRRLRRDGLRPLPRRSRGAQAGLGRGPVPPPARGAQSRNGRAGSPATLRARAECIGGSPRTGVVAAAQPAGSRALGRRTLAGRVRCALIGVAKVLFPRRAAPRRGGRCSRV